MRTLIHAGIVYAPSTPQADSLLIEDGLIAWVGQYSAIAHLGLSFDRELDLPDSFIAPGFVDSHVHLSATGSLLNSLDLRGAASAAEAISMVKEFAATSVSDLIIGHGWEDTNWPDRDQWTLEGLESFIGGRTLYLSRIDVHSALVRVPQSSGLVYREEHGAVREYIQSSQTTQMRKGNIETALKSAAAQGIVSLHENGGPTVSSAQDFADVLSFNALDEYPKIFGYWGSTDLSQVTALQAFGAAGDLNIDGSIGSRTALLHDKYCDHDSVGAKYLTSDQVSAHLVACTNAGIQGGFHAIGDGALSEVVTGLKQAAQQVGIDNLRKARHRIEHAEMLNVEDLPFLADAGVVLSMQPVFDELWGNTGGLYEQRLGKDRTSKMNSFAAIVRSGVTTAFSSDSPVTPIDPWRTISAATSHHTREHRISARAAFNAHTRGGWRAVKDDVAGVIIEGAPAHLAIWSAENLIVSVPDDRVRAWSTDERSGTPPLPDLSESKPKCIATLFAGKAIYDPTGIF